MNINDYMPTLEIRYGRFLPGFEVNIVKHNQQFMIAFARVNYHMHVTVYDSVTDSDYHKKSKYVDFRLSKND